MKIKDIYNNIIKNEKEIQIINDKIKIIKQKY